MKPAPFEYTAPGSLAEALAVLAEHGDAAKPLAGGQSLVPMLAMRLTRPRMLVSLKRLRELGGIRRDDGILTIGAMTRHWEVEESRDVAEASPLLAEAIGLVGHPTIRSRGTVGGSIAHADPAAELPAVLVALDGRVRLRSSRGERTVPAAEFFQGMMTTAARPDELLTEVGFSVPAGARRGAAFEEVARRHGDFAMAAAAVALTLDADGRVTDARIALCGVEARPRRCTEAESALRGERLSGGDRLRDAAALAAAGLDALDDLHASRAFRTHLAEVLTRRALERAYRRATGGRA